MKRQNHPIVREIEPQAIIVKNMSRLGCDYLKVGQVMEILRIRASGLSPSDGVDSDKGDDDFTLFRNIMKNTGC